MICLQTFVVHAGAHVFTLMVQELKHQPDQVLFPASLAAMAPMKTMKTTKAMKAMKAMKATAGTKAMSKGGYVSSDPATSGLQKKLFFKVGILKVKVNEPNTSQNVVEQIIE